MKKYLYAGLLTACLAAPAFAAANKLVPQSPEEPLHRRAVFLCMVVVVGLEAYKRRPRLPRRDLPTYHD
ncbi:hypothetical protein GTP46_00885 [Duganella sp. FT135W]|uniref:Uncharacterized protein n=1 Tax=Duganella flavida TaxID=2692175 RepID=A0A6L8K169_9BURK|nr:hypothetical protein [Duganella flavida]MYM21203.1 hypothetical protein [Duganella flavida]